MKFFALFALISVASALQLTTGVERERITGYIKSQGGEVTPDQITDWIKEGLASKNIDLNANQIKTLRGKFAAVAGGDGDAAVLTLEEWKDAQAARKAAKKAKKAEKKRVKKALKNAGLNKN